jgi:hypothetical protein
MRTLVTLTAVALALASCGQDPVSTQRTDNPNVPVGILFETDGCKVYRFVDAGRYVYFTNCAGTTTAFHTESCGKNCTRTVPQAVTTREIPND